MATEYDHDDEYNIVNGVDDDDYNDDGDDTVGRDRIWNDATGDTCAEVLWRLD